VEENFKLEMNEELTKKNRVHSESKGSKGIFYMAISALCMTLVAFVLKILYLNSDVNTYEFTYWSSIIMAIFNFSLFKSAGRDHLLVRDDLRVTLIVRSVCAFLGASGFFLALQYTDLSKATALYWTNPMMTAVIAYFALNESLACIDWLAIFVSFAGILVIQNPWAREVAPSFNDFHGTMAALSGALFIAIA
jgi:drug/metabolite transporter (DMT)-like permease